MPHQQSQLEKNLLEQDSFMWKAAKMKWDFWFHSQMSITFTKPAIMINVNDFSSTPTIMTKLIWFSKRTTLSRFQRDDHVGSTVIVPVDNIRILGVLLDSSLDVRKHISRVISACFFHLRRLLQICAGYSATNSVSCQQSYFPVLTTILAGLPSQWVMNAAAWFVIDLGPRDHSLQTMWEVHWFPIRQHIDFKIGMMMHVIVHGTVPEYMRDKVTSVADLPGRGHLRSAARGLFLQKSIMDISSIIIFKKQLKTHFFNLACTV